MEPRLCYGATVDDVETPLAIPFVVMIEKEEHLLQETWTHIPASDDQRTSSTKNIAIRAIV